jgi:hypothetical protein
VSRQRDTIPIRRPREREPHDGTVKGVCPMGHGGGTLMLDVDNRVICTWAACPRPTAADELLHMDTEHRVTVRIGGNVPRGRFAFSIAHPARCRLEHGDDLMACSLHTHLRELDEWPYDIDVDDQGEGHAGYIATWSYGQWLFTRNDT